MIRGIFSSLDRFSYHSVSYTHLDVYKRQGVGGDAVHPVVGPVHHKLNAPGNGAELADDELVPQERIVMGDMVLKLLRTVDVIVVGVLPYLDIGSGDDVFQKTDLFDRLVGVDGVGVWPVPVSYTHLPAPGGSGSRR